MARTDDTGPFAAYEWLLAFRYLGARRKEGFISIIAGFSFLGIMLGVATLIIVMSVMNGFRSELFSKMLGVQGHAVVYKIGGGFNDYDAVADRLATVQGVAQVSPMIEGQVMVSGPAATGGALVRGLRARDIMSIPLVGDRIVEGSLDGFDDSAAIAIGKRMAENLRVGIGDALTLVNPRGRSTPFGTKPNIKQYRIAAIFEIGMSEYDKTIAFLPLAEAQLFFNQRGRVNVLDIRVDDPDGIGALRPRLVQAGGPTVNIQDWTERNESFFTVLEVERVMMFIILSLIVLVAALNIISGLMMLVKDKGRDIAILRTMGATKGAMMRVFLITGASIGIVGTLCGLILGVLFATYIEPIRAAISWLLGVRLFDPSVYYLASMPAEVDPWETASIVVMAIVISILATLYPSWRASRLDPVEALRYE